MIISRVFVECDVRKINKQHNKGFFMFQIRKGIMCFKVHEEENKKY
jgi:hypothetical protein